MEIYLKRYFWTLPIFMIVICAVLVALGVNHVVEAKYLLGSDDAARRAAARQAGQADAAEAAAVKDAGTTSSGATSSARPATRPSPTDARRRRPPVDENHPPKTALPLALVSPRSSPRDPSVSAATIFNTSTFKLGQLRRRRPIPDAGRRCARIHPKSVYFRNKTTNRIERVELGAGARAAGRGRAARRRAPAPSPATPTTISSPPSTRA